MECPLELCTLDDARASSQALYDLCKLQVRQARHYGHRTWVLAHWKSPDICYDWGFMREGMLLRIRIYKDMGVRVNLTPTQLVVVAPIRS